MDDYTKADTDTDLTGCALEFWVCQLSNEHHLKSVTLLVFAQLSIEYKQF